MAQKPKWYRQGNTKSLWELMAGIESICPFCAHGKMHEIYRKDTPEYISKRSQCDCCGWIAAWSMNKDCIAKLEDRGGI